MNAYLEFDKDAFKGKTVLLPCDDPDWSNFTRYFAQNFKRLGLKKLISTSYAPNSKAEGLDYQPTLFEIDSPDYDEVKTRANGKIFTLTKDITGDGIVDFNDFEWKYLEGDGDFRSKEVTKLRDEADFVVTNPPFSLFREFIDWISEADKKFAIIGNMNAIGNKNVFPLFQKNKIWLGATNFNVGMYFFVPEVFVYSDSYKFEREIDGKKASRVAGVCWFTNIDHGRRHEPLKLMSKADNMKFNKSVKENGYPKYDNYDAIEVSKVESIPSDEKGIMGVPLTFLNKYNPDQFEILGATQRGCHDKVPDTKKYDSYWEVKSDGEKTGSSGGKTNENANLAGNDGKKNYFINSEGHIVQSAYLRIFIKHKKGKGLYELDRKH